MKQGRTLQQLAIELDRQQKAKRDFIIETSSIKMEGDNYFGLFKDVSETPTERFEANELFHRQVGTNLGIPASYYEKMRATAPQLLQQNVNHWFAFNPTKRLVRTLDNKARAFLSDRYRRMDNYEVANAVLPMLSGIPEIKIESCDMTDNRLYIKAINPRLETEIKVGDIVQGGIMISNSEVGLGCITIMPLIYRLVCKNGMIVNDLGMRKYHIGRGIEENWELFSDTTRHAEDVTLLSKIRDITKLAVDETKFRLVAGKLRDSAEIPITGYVPKVVEIASKEFGFNQNENQSILEHLIKGGDLSQYGLANAVTRASQDVDSYDRATTLEAAGFEVATMAWSQWERINAGQNKQ